MAGSKWAVAESGLSKDRCDKKAKRHFEMDGMIVSAAIPDKVPQERCKCNRWHIEPIQCFSLQGSAVICGKCILEEIKPWF